MSGLRCKQMGPAQRHLGLLCVGAAVFLTACGESAASPSAPDSSVSAAEPATAAAAPPPTTTAQAAVPQILKAGELQGQLAGKPVVYLFTAPG